jgi:hypothetical protein
MSDVPQLDDLLTPNPLVDAMLSIVASLVTGYDIQHSSECSARGPSKSHLDCNFFSVVLLQYSTGLDASGKCSCRILLDIVMPEPTYRHIFYEFSRQ